MNNNSGEGSMVRTQPQWNQNKKMAVLFLSQATLTFSTLTANITNPSIKTVIKSIAMTGAFKVGRGATSDGNITLCKDVRNHGLLKESLHVLSAVYQRDMRPDLCTFAHLLQGCLDLRALPQAKLVHAHIILTGLNPHDIFICTRLVIIYANCGVLLDARRLFDQMPQRNVVSWTSMIAAYTRHGYAQEALTLFHDMQRNGIRPNQFTFASVLPAYANLAALKQGKLVHEDIIRSGFQSDVYVANGLVNMYVKCGSIDNARQAFDKIAERNIVTWTAMIAGYAQNGRVDEALKLFLKMPERNVVSWNAMIAGYGQNEHVDEALCLFQNIPERNVVSWNATISCCVRNGYFHEALQLFQKMTERNVVSWTAMIAGNAQNGNFSEALKLFRHMQWAGMKPDSNTFTSVLPVCAHSAILHEGKGVHEAVIRGGFHSDIFVENALVDMYAKCGSIDYARKVFDKMHRRDAVSWTAMIVGYAMHGCGKEALQLFDQMQNSGTEPDHVTFIGILSACCHAGQVNDGWRYFDSMSRDYNITPAVEHYCCMVDLLGRAGRLHEAQEFINNMPIKPNAAVWGSLLGACRIHMDIKLGKCVAEHLFELDPKTAAHYVLLSNIYAAAGRWDEVEKVRKLMKDRKVKKMPGCSWIQVSNKVYGFLTGDKSHPEAHKIYAMLDRLSGQMKEAGYMPATNFVLHDVEEEQKEHILSHHSEKLAVAFGLINTSHGTPIQVVKNLRVCDDCHSAIKIISNIVAREIVVRDANRFHHFKDGWCSCGDYW